MTMHNAGITDIKGSGIHGNDAERSAAVSGRYSALGALYRKEMADHIKGKRFWIILLLVVITTAAGIYGASTGLKDALEKDSNFVFLKLFTTGGNAVPSYVSFMALIGPFVGLMLGFDAVNSERSNGTLGRLLAQPIYRDNVIIGKFLAGTVLIAILVIAGTVLTGAAGFLTAGLLPTGEELARVLVYMIYSILYICFWLALAIMFSVFCRHSATSALASIAVWVIFAVFISLLSGFLANVIYPVNTEYEQAANAMKNYNCQLYINRISPYYLYTEAVSTILNPSVRAVNAVTISQLVGAINGYLPFSQSLMLVWPDLFSLAALTLIVFVISYVRFMRQEVRGN